MKRLPNNAVHKALYEFLSENIETPVYDYVPQDAALPFVTLGAVNVEDKSTKSEDMTHVSVQVHLWSDYKGRYEINNLAEEIINLLGNNQLDLTGDGFYANAQGVDFYETYPEDESGFNGVLTFEMLVQDIGEVSTDEEDAETETSTSDDTDESEDNDEGGEA